MANPKVFSLFKTKNYAECFPNISVLGKKVDFFLECSSYDVILPVKVKGDSKLDVFEEAVLKQSHIRQQHPRIWLIYCV